MISLGLLLISPLVARDRGGLDPLFQSTLDFYGKLIRTNNGMYRDAYELRGKQSKRCSSAAVGVGLISLCIEHELKRDPQAEEKALRTLRAINGKVDGFQIDREKAGYFRHFFQADTGKGKGEYSTIDTAIMIVGVQFCRNYFDSSEIWNEADELWGSIKWELALARQDGSKLHMVMEDGLPKEKTVTSLFNEYYLLAALIREKQIQERGASDLVSFSDLPTWEHGGETLLSDWRKVPHCSFLIQFPFYLTHECASSLGFTKFVKAQAVIDQRVSTSWSGHPSFWGNGAGMMPSGGYQANVYSKNPEKVISPHIIAGFISVFPNAKAHLLELYQDSKVVVESPVGKLLPRVSLKCPGWRSPRIEAIDYSSMLYGLAADHPKLGMKFFIEGARFSFRKQTK